jgi:hypothetical protein
MTSRIFFSVCVAFLVFCVFLGSCSRYLPTKRSPSAMPAMPDYDQDMYPRGIADRLSYIPGAEQEMVSFLLRNISFPKREHFFS